MKAMQLYWSYLAGEAALERVDQDVERLLASMDPSAAAEHALGDTLLAAFFFWGGLYIALADGLLDAHELERLASVAPAGVDIARLATSPAASDTCLQRFHDEIAGRRRKFSSVELYRIVEGLVHVASADGHIDPREIERLHRLGHMLGLTTNACELLLANTMKET
jgi:tellurite resistance protein